jgi:hypothetical protein
VNTNVNTISIFGVSSKEKNTLNQGFQRHLLKENLVCWDEEITPLSHRYITKKYKYGNPPVP